MVLVMSCILIRLFFCLSSFLFETELDRKIKMFNSIRIVLEINDNVLSRTLHARGGAVPEV